jgi:hypothetical protein
MFCKVKGCRFKTTHTTRGHLCSKCKLYGHGKMECGRYHNLNNYYDEILPVDKQCRIEGCKYKIYHTNEAHHCPKCLQNHSINDCPQIKFCVNIQPKFQIKCPMCRQENNIDKIQEKSGNDNCCVCLDKKATVFYPKCKHICCCLSCTNKLNKNSDDLSIYNLYNEILNEEQMKTYCDIINIKKSLSKILESKIYTISYAGMGCSLFIRRDFIDGTLLGFFLHSDCQGQYGINHIPFVKKFIENYTLHNANTL